MSADVTSETIFTNDESKEITNKIWEKKREFYSDCIKAILEENRYNSQLLIQLPPELQFYEPVFKFYNSCFS